MDELVSTLNEDPAAFSEIRKFVDMEHGGDEAKYRLLLRKGVFPYSYITDMKTLEERQLPPISAFHNDLTDDPCSPEDYRHVQEMWSVFGMTTLKDLLELYVKLDVLQLDAVFQRYRAESLSAYSLDPLFYYTAPGSS